jgi:hypothetical protein
MTFVLDIGGEGRHADAWNLNPSLCKTLEPGRGTPIPRLILGRADAIPLPSQSVDRVIVERTPLTAAALCEIRRVTRPGGSVVLRHAAILGDDPHATAKRTFGTAWKHRKVNVAGVWLEETEFWISRDSVALAATAADNQPPLGEARPPSARAASALA